MRLDVLRSLVRDLGVIAARASDPLANLDLARDLQNLAPSFDLARLTRAYASIDKADAALGRNASPKIVADWVALNL